MINFSPACERNKTVILQELAPYFSDIKNVLEIGSFSGQHALYFSQQLPTIQWQPTDLTHILTALRANIAEANSCNCLPPMALDVLENASWPTTTFDAIFTANTLHIMSWQHVQAFFAHLPKVCKPETLLCIYGPFKYQDEFTSESNKEFQLWLQQKDQKSGIRDFEAVNELAKKQGFILQSDKCMPAHNQLIIWKMAKGSQR